MAFPPDKETGPVRLPRRSAALVTAPLHGATPVGRPDGERERTQVLRHLRSSAMFAKARDQRASGKERGKSASGSAQNRRTLKERSGKECDY